MSDLATVDHSVTSWVVGMHCHVLQTHIHINIILIYIYYHILHYTVNKLPLNTASQMAGTQPGGCYVDRSVTPWVMVGMHRPFIKIYTHTYIYLKNTHAHKIHTHNYLSALPTTLFCITGGWQLTWQLLTAA